MRIEATEIPGVMRIEAEPHVDARGAFARLYCPDEFAAAGIEDFRPVQVNLSRNTARHTLRGLHFQRAPHAEAKLVQVAHGEIFDVAVDLRPNSPTYRRWIGARLDAESMTGLYIPEGCAHGFLTLEPETDVLYLMGRMFEPGHDEGLRWDDSAIGVVWPARPVVISERDASYPDWKP